jgi:hypothetical protein
MHSAQHVDSGFGLEQFELGANARVEVDEFVLAVAAIEAPVEVRDAAVADVAA